MPMQSLQDALLNELHDILSAEKQLTKALPKMSRKATSQDLKKAFDDHLEETRGHVQRVEQALGLLGQKPKAKKCEAMEGIINEGEEVMEHEAEPVVMDALLIAAAQKVEHYEIASYGAVCTWAEQVGEKEVATLLKQNMSEEKNADSILKQAARKINRQAK
jgi:ferritin-like metal-binding protein YciE